MDQSPNYTQSQAPTKSKRPLIIGIGLLAAVLAGLSIFAATTSESTCISPEDYVSFYGEAPLKSRFNPTVSFFTNSYLFTDGTATIDTNESDSPAIDAAALARFYKERPKKPMVLTVSAGYNAGDSSNTKPVAEARAKLLGKSLTDAGIPAAAITTTVSPYTAASDDERSDAVHSASITLASASSCKE